MLTPLTVTTTPFLHPRPSLLFSSFTLSLSFRLNPNPNPKIKPYFFNLPSMASSLIAEYAKSKRSSCKTCSDTIAANALRLGVVTKDKQKGFDMTKWHHFHCFSFASHRVSSLDAIRGFDSLKSDDQEAMKKLVDENAKVKDSDEDTTAADKQKNTKKRMVKDTGDEQKHALERKVKDTDEDETAGNEQGSTKKMKLSMPEDSKVVIDLTSTDIKDNFEDATLPPNWKAFHTIIFLEKGDRLHDSSKIAAFDFDGCLANTDVRRSGADAWSLMYESIPEKLQKLYNDGYKLVIFTNESNISRWKNKRQKAVDSKIGRLNNFIKLVKVPIQVFIACGFGPKDAYRKPKAGMWFVMEQHFNSGIPVDMDKSFYVGDAAGRPNDHSNADIQFAKDIGLKFYVPEEYFTE